MTKTEKIMEFYNENTKTWEPYNDTMVTRGSWWPYGMQVRVLGFREYDQHEFNWLEWSNYMLEQQEWHRTQKEKYAKP
jgi:hypothetical protein